MRRSCLAGTIGLCLTASVASADGVTVWSNGVYIYGPGYGEMIYAPRVPQNSYRENYPGCRGPECPGPLDGLSVKEKRVYCENLLASKTYMLAKCPADIQQAFQVYRKAVNECEKTKDEAFAACRAAASSRPNEEEKRQAMIDAHFRSIMVEFYKSEAHRAVNECLSLKEGESASLIRRNREDPKPALGTELCLASYGFKQVSKP